MIGLAESTYHYHVKQSDKEDPDSEWKELITTIFYAENERMGYRGIQDELIEMGYKINHKKVQRLMRELGLKCTKFTRKSRRYNSYKGPVGTQAKNWLKRRFFTSVPLQKLVTDVSEFKCSDEKKLYLSPIIDLYSTEVLAFNISNSPTVEFVMKPLEEAIEIINEHAPFRTTIHSDQGFQYQNKRWVQALKDHKIFQSMSRKGTCADNAAMESFFGILKQEMYYGEPLKSYEELKQEIEEYIYHYNHFRRKRSLNRLSPVVYRVQNTQIISA